MAFELYPYQKEGVALIQQHKGRVILGDDMGLGKTIQAVTWLAETAKVLPAVIVCPASVKHTWETALAEALNTRPQVLEGKGLGEQSTPLLRRKVTIINYDILHCRLDQLVALGPRTVILDEGQNCTNRDAYRTEAAKELARISKYLLILTGTPLLNRPAELWTLLNMVDPIKFNSFWSYGHRYCAPELTHRGWEYKGAQNLGELHRLLKNYMIRRTKAQVLSQLPRKIRRIVHIPLSDAAQYQHAERDFVGWLKKHERHKVKKAKKALKVSRFGYLRRLAARLKLRGVVNWINAWLAKNDANEKLIVFACHTKMIEAIVRRVNSPTVMLNGEVSQADRKLRLAKFRSDDACRVMVANLLAVGTGFDGMQIASTAAMVELDLRPGIVLQTENRLHRIGQQSKTTIYYLLGQDTIEVKLCELLQKKQLVVSTTLDGGTQDGDFDVFNRLMEGLL